jgi:hypothetical protein
MAKPNTLTYTPRTKVRRRNKLRPFNHSKKVSKRSGFKGMRKRMRGQG